MTLRATEITRGFARITLAVALFACALAARADLTPGRDYARIDPPQPTGNPAKIEVTEFFSYSCPHCNELQPFISKWAAKLPKDVTFVRVPVSFGRPEWEVLARTYYTLQISGDIERLDSALFHAIHEEHMLFADQKSAAAWVTKQGVDSKKFNDLYGSFSVISKTAQAQQLSRKLKIEGVPTLIVNGKYRVLASGTRTYADWFPILDQLVAKARAEKASR